MYIYAIYMSLHVRMYVCIVQILVFHKELDPIKLK